MASLLNSTIKGLLHNPNIKVFKKDLEESDEGCVYLYRGHTNSNYFMTPSVFRVANKLSENEIYSEVLRTHFHPDFENMSDFEILSKMQHYQVPTRLLDLTHSPLVASFFALSGLDGKLAKTKNPEIVSLKIKKENIKNFYSPEVVALSTLPKLTVQEQRELYIDMLNEISISQGLSKYFKSDKDEKGSIDSLYFANNKMIDYVEFITLTLCKFWNENVYENNEFAKECSVLLKRELSSNYSRNYEVHYEVHYKKNDEREIRIQILASNEENLKPFKLSIHLSATGDNITFIKSYTVDIIFTETDSAEDNEISYYLVKNENSNNVHIYPTEPDKYAQSGLLKNCKNMEIYKLRNGSYFSKTAEKMHYYILKQNPTFRRDLKPLDLINGVIVEPIINNERVNSQHGAFALYGLSKYWNFEKTMEYLARYNLPNTNNIILNNFGFIDENKDFVNSENDLHEFENYVFDLGRFAFSKNFVKNHVQTYLHNLSLMAGIDVKSLGCRMDSTYLQMLRNRS